MKTFIRIFSIIVLLHSILLSGTTGKITGKITDSKTGEGLIGVNVLIAGTTLGASSDIDGYYVILNIPPGKYNLLFSSLGYNKKTVSNVAVSIDLTTKIEISLDPAIFELDKEVVIVAERPIIKKDLTSVESHIESGAIKSLPVQEVSQIIAIQAGVTVDRGGGIHIRGGRSSEVAYWVDGVSVSDSYDGSQAIQIDKNSIQELQVISGTFNAEYGQAMSGIVNSVTKDGGENLSGSMIYYFGNYFTNNKNLYLGLDNKFSSPNNYNVEGNLSGPIIKNLTFYLSGRFLKSDGHLFGIRNFNPNGTKGDSEIVPMNNRNRKSGQAKLTYNFQGGKKISFSAFGSDIKFRDYNHGFKYNPDGDVQKFDKGLNLSLMWTHTLSSNTFYTLNFSNFQKDFKEYLYEDPFNLGYNLNDMAFDSKPYEFLKAGTNRHHFNRNTNTSVFKSDLTSQINQLHQVKLGIEFKQHKLYFDDFNIVSEYYDSSFHALIPETTNPNHNQYTEKPIEYSAYIQDKIEYENMIVNVGLRVDYFDSKGKILADEKDPNVYLPQIPTNKILSLSERLSKWYKNASPKISISPRFGISYPITAEGALHFSYGHFLQIPSFMHLYQNPGFKVTTASGVHGVFGNANLNPQKTVMYELGIQQQITENLSFDLTGFYRDTRDWVSTSPLYPVRDAETATTYYTIFVNRDYANSRGITLSFTKHKVDLISFNFAYTFQIAEGVNSNPEEEQGKRASGDNSLNVELSPLDWDQTHTLNATFGLSDETWGAFMLGRFGSGLPYSPVINQAGSVGEDATRQLTKNSRRRPTIMNFDLNLYKNYSLMSHNFSTYIKIFNLFDRRNEVDIYGQTGRSTASIRSLGAEPLTLDLSRINKIEDYINRADFYSEPREVQIGFEISF
ncbi:MAG: TonB-dependent receptor [Bacteroidota bacterium]